MPICSHGIPYESKCRGCFEDAMKFLRANPTPPKPNAPVDQEKFFLAAFGQYVDATVPAEKK
jgi:hypothetical protein